MPSQRRPPPSATSDQGTRAEYHVRPLPRFDVACSSRSPLLRLSKTPPAFMRPSPAGRLASPGSLAKRRPVPPRHGQDDLGQPAVHRSSSRETDGAVGRVHQGGQRRLTEREPPQSRLFLGKFRARPNHPEDSARQVVRVDDKLTTSGPVRTRRGGQQRSRANGKGHSARRTRPASSGCPLR